jgi:NAD(P)-dependent dehydrogenase (short-subunit alcohol dehydrogenase family)
VVVVSSVAHRWAWRGLDRTDIQSARGFRGTKAYGRSKLANVLFTRELARQLDGTGVTANAVHPGSVNTHFATDGDTGAMGWWIATFGPYVLRTPQVGARTSVVLASSADPKVAGSSGGYWSHGRRWRPARAARDDEAARWLWETSARLVASVS